MHRSPRTGPHPFGRPALAAVVLCALAVGAAGCAADTGTRDDGAAPQLSPPVTASPLWPRYTPPTPAGDEPTPPYRRYVNVKDVEVRGGDLRRIPVKQLLEQDPNVPQLVRTAMLDCPGDACGLREPVYRDLTEDGRDELVVALDDEAGGLTMIQVYRVFGTAVRPILVSWSPLGVTGVTFGHDMVLTSTGKDGRFTTRYRWNGTELVPAPPPDTLAGEPSASPLPSSRTDR